VRINIPPVSVNNDEIYIVGEKEGVARVVQALQKEHDIVVSLPIISTSNYFMINSAHLHNFFLTRLETLRYRFG